VLFNASTEIDTWSLSFPFWAHHSPDPRNDTPIAVDVNDEQVRREL
jgi:hypothetical protein